MTNDFRHILPTANGGFRYRTCTITRYSAPCPAPEWQWVDDDRETGGHGSFTECLDDIDNHMDAIQARVAA